jgi:hypothetical protein
VIQYKECDIVRKAKNERKNLLGIRNGISWKKSRHNQESRPQGMSNVKSTAGTSRAEIGKEAGVRSVGPHSYIIELIVVSRF